MKKSKKFYAVILAVLVLGGGYFWYKKASAVPVAVQYKTEVVEKKVLTSSISGSGSVIVDQSSTVDPTITGTVANLAVNVGDVVKKGQTLFTIINEGSSVSNAKAAASLQQAQNSVDSAGVSVKEAKENYRSGRKDSAGNSSADKKILKEKINLAENNLLAAQKSYAASLADYNNQLADSRKRTVTAPIDGTVNAVNIKNGDDLGRLSSSSNSSAPIIIGDLNTLKAQIQVNEVDITAVAVGQKVMLKFNAIDGLNVSGKVEKIDSLGTVSQGVVTYNVTIDFDVIDSNIKPEMTVLASIIAEVKSDVIAIPNSALKMQSDGDYVQVLKNGVPENVLVEVGIANNAETEIIRGLSVGDELVTQTIDPNASAITTGGGGGMRIPGFGGGGH